MKERGSKRTALRVYVLIFYFLFFLPNQADDQRDQEERDPDDPGRKPYPRTECAKLIQREIVMVGAIQGTGVPIHRQADRKDFTISIRPMKMSTAPEFLPFITFPPYGEM